MNRRLIIGLIVVVVVLAGILLILNQFNKAPKNPKQNIPSNTVLMENYTFTPDTITVNKGTTVTWTNNDSVAHSVVSDTGVFSSPTVNPGDKFQFTFNNAGTFPYHSSLQTYMTGIIIVK